MDWTVYWFMLPVCIAVASIAMFSGMSGAAMLIPVFLIGFPLLGVPALTTVAAIGTSLLLETSGFGTVFYRYLKLRLIDAATAWRLIAITLPLGAIGAIASAQAPEQALRLGYGAAMIGLAALLSREVREHAPRSAPAAAAIALARTTGSHPCGPIPGAALAGPDEPPHLRCPRGVPRRITTASGQSYHYCAHGLRGQQLLSGIGAFVAGLISTGVGEATLPGLIRRSRFPAPVAAATSTVVVAGTVVGAALTHMTQLAADGGFTAIPWNLIVWAVPGAILGAVVGTGLQGKISSRATRWFFTALFFAIGATFLLAFTVFAHRSGNAAILVGARVRIPVRPAVACPVAAATSAAVRTALRRISASSPLAGRHFPRVRPGKGAQNMCRSPSSVRGPAGQLPAGTAGVQPVSLPYTRLHRVG
jgi:uncharacterized membrane protein YfcA